MLQEHQRGTSFQDLGVGMDMGRRREALIQLSVTDAGQAGTPGSFHGSHGSHENAVSMTEIGQ